MDLAVVNLIDVLYAIATLALISVGLAIIFGMMRVINLAHGEFLMLGGYVSGTSLIAAPLVVPVAASRMEKYQLRDTLFVLWFVLVAIKLVAFMVSGVDLQWRQHLWLLPCAAVGHVIGLRFHAYTLKADTKVFFQVLGVGLLAVSLAGLWRILG